MNIDKTSDTSMLSSALSQLSGTGGADKGFEDAFHTAMGVQTADEMLEDALGIKGTAFSSSSLTGSTNPYATQGTLLQSALADKLTDEDAVRELLKRMNIEVVELEEAREETDFCGTSLYSPAPTRNLRLAPKRFVENAAGKFEPRGEDERKRLMVEYCSQITTDKVVAYCHYCTQGLAVGGKNDLHLAQLLFPGDLRKTS